jgi:hypothetical protein
MKLEKLKVGGNYYSVERVRVGNTTMRCDAIYLVRVLEIGADYAVVSWNGNRAERYYSKGLARLREHPPEWVRGRDGTRCHVCRAREHDGHVDTCEHPRAAAARKRAAKGKTL